MKLDEYQELIDSIESLEKELSRDEVAYEEGMRRLKKEFGVSTLKEAKEELETMKEMEIKLARRITKAKEQWEKKWGQKL